MATGTIIKQIKDSNGEIHDIIDTTYSDATTSTAGLMSAEDKTKLNGIATNANNYTHPTTAGNKHIPAGGSSGQYLKYSAAGTATWVTPSNNTATTSAAGFMSSTDKSKLNNLPNFHILETNVSNASFVPSLSSQHKIGDYVCIQCKYVPETGQMSINNTVNITGIKSQVGTNIDLYENGVSCSSYRVNASKGFILAIISDTNRADIIKSSKNDTTLNIIYGSCDTSSTASTKHATCNINIYDNDLIYIYFKYYNTSTTPSLSISNLENIPIFYEDVDDYVTSFRAGCHMLVYDGTYFRMLGKYLDINGNAGSADSADKLLNARTIDGINFDGSSNVKHYGTCTTSSATVAKVANISNFTLNTGSMVVIDFSYDNTATSPTLNISDTGAKSICQLSTSTSVGAFKRGCYIFVYDGTYWQMLNSIETAIDSNYASCSTASGSAAKTATITGFTLTTGATALIQFTNDNTHATPTLNINSTGAKSLYLGSYSSVGVFNAGLYLIVYDGTYYRMINSVNATKLSFKTSSTNASYIVPFLDKSSYSAGTNSVYVGHSTTYPFSFNPSTGILTVKQTSSSDERLKDFVKDIDINFDNIKKIPKRYFTWKCDEEKHLHIGTSAQELEKFYPELVSEYGNVEEGLYKAVDYSTLSIIALAAIDKLNDRIVELENKIKELEQA